MTEKAVREIRFEKGAPFTTQFILLFDKRWGAYTRRLKKSGVDLSRIPIVIGEEDSRKKKK